jgi:hypothetical protein
VLDAYRTTPGTYGVIRRPDRLLAAHLHERGVPVEAVENAFVLAAARRMARTADAYRLRPFVLSPTSCPCLKKSCTSTSARITSHICASASPASRLTSSPQSSRHAFGVDEAALSSQPALAFFAPLRILIPKSSFWSGSF